MWKSPGVFRLKAKFRVPNGHLLHERAPVEFENYTRNSDRVPLVNYFLFVAVT